MTHLTRLTFLAVLLSLVTAAQAQVFTTNITYPVTGGSISDGNPVGLTSVGNVSGVSGFITNVSVNLNITGGFNGDLYAYLVSPAGQFVVLLNRVGVGSGNPFGYSDTGFNITLDSSGANVHTYQLGSPSFNGSGQLTGTWAADGRNINPQSTPSVFDSAATTANLSLFNSTLPNGAWTLFIADLSSGGQSTLVSWGLTIVTVPEPQTWAMLVGGAGMLLAFRRRKIS